MEIHQRLSVKVLKMIYLFKGFSCNPIHQKYLSAIILAYCCLLIPIQLYFGAVTAFDTTEAAGFRVEATVISLFLFNFSILFLLIHIQRDRWMRFYETLNRFCDLNFCDDLDARLLADKGYVIILPVFFIFVYSCPMMIAFATNVELGSYTTLLFPTKYPWRANTAPTYTMTILCQVLGGSIASCMFFGNIGFIYYFRAFILSARLMLKREICRLNFGYSATFENEWACRKRISLAHDEKETDVQYLQNIVRDHQLVTRYANFNCE